MTWLLAAIFAYFLLAVVFLIDKYLLKARLPSPKIYSFYIGGLGALALVLIPFVDFLAPEQPPRQIFLSILAGAVFIFALFIFYSALKKFDVSRVAPAVGGILPLFTLGLVYFFLNQKEVLEFREIIAFAFLVVGSLLITIETRTIKNISLKSFQLAALAAFFLALSFVLMKLVYLNQPFWSGFIWMRIGGLLIAFCFLATKEVREELFSKRVILQKKTAAIFLSNQMLGGGAFILQNWAVYLAPLAFVAIINALQGIQYVFLLIFTIFLSLKFPWFLKEKISLKILLQKIFAILLIGAGLALLVL